MKKSVKIVAALCLMAALVLTLAACGKKDPVGIWECTNYQEAIVKGYRARGNSYERINEVIAESGPLSLTMILQADHSVTTHIYAGKKEDTHTAEWMETENGIAIIGDDADIVYFEWDGSKLVGTEDGCFVYIFQKR